MLRESQRFGEFSCQGEVRGIIWTYASVSGSSVGHQWRASILYQNLQYWFLISLFCDCYKLTLPLWILWAPLVSLTHKGTRLSLVAVTLCLLWWKLSILH